MWKGATEILNSKPTAVVASARKTIGSQAGRASMAARMSKSFVEPAMPYITEKP